MNILLFAKKANLRTLKWFKGYSRPSIPGCSDFFTDKFKIKLYETSRDIEKISFKCWAERFNIYEIPVPIPHKTRNLTCDSGCEIKN